MTIPIIALSNVHLSLESNAGTIEILKNISLNVSTGESLALIGPSGSGKSSLLMLLGGLERASSGSVRVAGTELSDLNEDQLAFLRRDQMGIVFQSFHLIPTMSALENVATPLELAGVTDAFKKARGALDTVGLTHRQDHFPGQLSGGEQQRVALARAVVAQPKILLADEPTGNLDGINGIAIMDLLFSLRDQFGSTLILVTHD
ncbi:ABC transporter ATP-binding protein, partial [Paracoccaceae bacterium]|nr:ABC transporter ATP-binding protein [Paracoccaceae bacterium]